MIFVVEIAGIGVRKTLDRWSTIIDTAGIHCNQVPRSTKYRQKILKPSCVGGVGRAARIQKKVTFRRLCGSCKLKKRNVGRSYTKLFVVEWYFESQAGESIVAWRPLDI